LVTGGGGFLGRYIVEQLVARGDQVRTFSRGAYPELKTTKVEAWRGDLRDAATTAAACAGMDVVFHAAGVAGIWGPWDHFFGINTLGTRNVVAGCRQHGVRRLVYTSSPSVTFDGNSQEHVDESAPYPRQWLCHYPHSKALAEQHVLQANGQGGLATCALRPHLIWGPRDNHLIPRLLARARRGQLRQVGQGQNMIDITYAENAAAAHVQAADALAVDSPVGGKAYFISQAHPVNCWQWINEILLLANLPPVTKSISQRAAWCVGVAMESTYRILRLSGEPRMTRFLALQFSSSHHFDVTRAKNDFGYQPQVSTEEGMRRLAQSLE
jgi:nucleoside-diphosphate-sugar epimerase